MEGFSEAVGFREYQGKMISVTQGIEDVTTYQGTFHPSVDRDRETEREMRDKNRKKDTVVSEEQEKCSKTPL